MGSQRAAGACAGTVGYGPEARGLDLRQRGCGVVVRQAHYERESWRRFGGHPHPGPLPSRERERVAHHEHVYDEKVGRYFFEDSKYGF